MAHLSTERFGECQRLLRRSGIGGGACCPRCGDPLPGTVTSERELVWTAHLGRFGLSADAAPLLERKERP